MPSRSFSVLRGILNAGRKLNAAAGGVASICNAIASKANEKYLTLDATTGQMIDESGVYVPLTKVATVTLTAAQVKALRATPQTLVAAPGSGYVLEFVAALLILDYATAAFTETSDNLVVRYTGTTGTAASQAIEATGFIDQTADSITNAQPVNGLFDATPDALAANIANAALVLHNTGDGEYGGSSASTLTIKTLYRVWATGL